MEHSAKDFPNYEAPPENIKKSQDLGKYIERCKQRLQSIITLCKWKEEDVMKDFNTNHCSPAKNPKATIDPNDLPLPESFPSLNSMVIGEKELKNLLGSPTAEIPQRFSDIQLNLSREQKLILYEHVVQATGKCSEPELTVSVLNKANSSSNDMTFAQIVAAKKREKKLRRKYRTSKPTHIEEVRNLVELQMQALEQYFKPKIKMKKEETPERHRNRQGASSQTRVKDDLSIRRNKTEMNTSRRTDRMYLKREHSESRDRELSSRNSERNKTSNRNYSYQSRIESRERWLGRSRDRPFKGEDKSRGSSQEEIHRRSRDRSRQHHNYLKETKSRSNSVTNTSVKPHKHQHKHHKKKSHKRDKSRQ